MSRVKGTPKTGGRKKGTRNHIPDKDSLRDFVNAEIDRIPTLIGVLNPVERLNFLAKIIPFVRPKKQEIDIKSEVEALMNNLDHLTEPQLKRLEDIITDVIKSQE